MESQKRLGLYFNCDEKFEHSHNRVCKRIFFLELLEANDAEDTATADDPHISLLAMAGVRTPETMQVRIQMGGTTLLALLDSGTTHNFVSEEATARTSLQLQSWASMKVTVANGDWVPYPGAYRVVPFSIDGERFTTDFFALPLAGYDVVLGTDWLAMLGPILWDFGTLTMSFWHGDHRVCRSGVASSPAPSLRACSADDLLPALLEEFAPVFVEPSGMPPPRSQDHSITLRLGSTPVVVRPYHYPATHKDELERQCTAMLNQGII
ncbi:uncharacterized protein [Miscanthus floridulus]|uniref:uncharacterized protein n=1 Tax=Miscanthus floridulus TaxID=154761 RepID=UPI00345825D0